MNTYLFLGMLCCLSLLYRAFALFGSKKSDNTLDYFLAHRSLGIIPLTFTLIAIQLGSGMLLGTAEMAYKNGFYGILYSLGMALGFIILSLGFASKLRGLNISTTAQVFETRYNSEFLKGIASILSIISLCGILIGQIVASKQLLIGLDVYDPIILTCMWLLVITYTMIGGLHSVVLADIAQVSFIIIIFTVVFFKTLFSLPASVFTVKAFFYIQKQFKHSADFSTLLSAFLMTVLFSLIEQDLAQRFFAAKSKMVARISAFAASLFILAFTCIPVFFGIATKFSMGRLPVGANPLIAYLEHYSSPVIFVLIVCGILAAITSTADSLLCAISSNISQDFNHILKKPVTISQAKVITCLTGIITLACSFLIHQNILGILGNSYKICVSCLFIPTVIAYFYDNLSARAGFLSMLFGAIGFGISLFMASSVQKELLPLGLSLLGYILGSILSKILVDKNGHSHNEKKEYS